MDLNGTAADIVIAVSLCMGVVIPESMGLGGGGVIVFYNRSTQQSYSIDAREEAPRAATKNMYKNSTMSQTGPLSIAVPGALAGYWELHQKSGRLSWNRLFVGAIKYAKHGFKVSEHMAYAIKLNEGYIKNHTAFGEIYLNKKTGQVIKENETLIQTTLAKTLEKLAKSRDPLKLFYENSMAQDIIDDIKDATNDWPENEIITLDDFRDYRIDTTKDVIKTQFKRENLTLHTMPLPGTGILLSFIMKVMENFDDLYPNAFKSLNTSILFYHRLMETFKYTFSCRMFLGDDNFEDMEAFMHNLSSPYFIDRVHNDIDDRQTYNDSKHYGPRIFMSEDHGTSHVSVIDKYGNAVAISATVNMYFGSKVLSRRTGLVLNDEMDDFSSNFTNTYGVPPSDHNLIQPYKRPLSSMCPSIFVEPTGNVRLIIGASGGTKIITGVAVVAIRHLWMNETIKQAIDWPRLHHQLWPNKIIYESNFPKDILEGLKRLGHKTEDLGQERGAIVMAINRYNNLFYANSDFRKGGDVDGL
ncbi:scoloptoxin SSD14-like [Oppia nitens]|uniref:scoloptoxin SSD14-like n=1 Tax=Oppia nitens TaxID=1686743 RepID=UPI0023D9F2D7|nr:scoloptoxin SSD14-like [Oppia nitens]